MLFQTDSHSESDSQRLAQLVAELLCDSLVICLIGDLGAGKTFFTKALTQALGFGVDAVNSPTFVLHQQYQADRVVDHYDWYRIRDEDELWEIGFEEVLDSGSIVFIEWADKFPQLLPDERLEIHILATGAQQRQFVFHPWGDRAIQLCESVQGRLNSQM